MKKLVIVLGALLVVAWFAEPESIVINGNDVTPILAPLDHNHGIVYGTPGTVTSGTTASTSTIGSVVCSTIPTTNTVYITQASAGSL